MTLKKFAKFWLPILLWAVVIYSASGDKHSVHRSSRIIEPIVRWLVPDISNENLWRTVLLVRKSAHVVEYAVLAALLHRALRGTAGLKRTDWSWKYAGFAWGLATAFAITDEWHQLFVPGRQGSAWDVILDSSGAVLGILFVWLVGWSIRRRKEATAISKAE